MTSPAVWGELLRAAGALALLPLRAAHYASRREALEREAVRDLDVDAEVTPAPRLEKLPDRPLRIFLSCAERSGEIHAANLADALREAAATRGAPPPELSGLGGTHLAARGVDCIGDPVARATMGFDVLSSLPYYMRLLSDAQEHMRATRADLFLPIDSPALHVPLARLAKRAGVPVVHFVTPQYWGWAPWRVHAYRRVVDRALCILPFELPWFERHAVPVAHVGHPLRDQLAGVPRAERSDPNLLALLPGSRHGVVRRNLPWMLRVVADLAVRQPDLQVVLPCGDGSLAPLARSLVAAQGAEGRVRVVVGDLHSVLARAHTAFSVSGTVLLDLLHHRLPAVVVYRLENGRQTWAYRHFLTTPYFSSVNLLAGAPAYPEFCFAGDGPREEASAALLRLHSDAAARSDCLRRLERAFERLGPPGAVQRAARHALEVAAGAAAPTRHPLVHA